MKTLFKCLPLVLFSLILFGACDSDSNSNDEGTKELVLSVEPDEYNRVYTDQMDFEFEVLQGNGTYKVTVLEHDNNPDAIVNVEGNKVVINMLVHTTIITITDVKGEEQSFVLKSTNEILNSLLNHYGLNLGLGQEYLLFSYGDSFGAGAPYTIERTRGNSSEATIVDGVPQIKSLSQGIAYYTLKDRRGSTLPISVTSGIKNYELSETTKLLEIEVKNNDYTWIDIHWGEEWKIAKSEEKILEDLFLARPYFIGKDGKLEMSDYYTLGFYTTDTGVGTNTITLENKAGEQAIVKVTIK